ncbi:Maf family protein [Lachnospiraceae bacterium 62-35]
MRIILGSASPRRKMLLEQVGLTPEIIPSRAEESPLAVDPEGVVLELSEKKAEDVAAFCKRDGDDMVVLGADTLVAVEGKILGKPESRQEAEEMISLLAGKVHQVYTGVSLILIEQGKIAGRQSFAEKTDVSVYPMEPEEIRAYVDSGEPMDKAGAYGIQGFFAAYIKGINGDYSNVVGLPLGRTCQALKQWRKG